MTTKTWKIEALESKPQDGELTNVAITAHWRLLGSDDANTATVYGSIALAEPSEPFIPYDQLTELEVIDWVKAQMGPEQVAAHELAIEQQLTLLKNPPVVVLPLPWVSSLTTQTEPLQSV